MKCFGIRSLAAFGVVPMLAAFVLVTALPQAASAQVGAQAGSWTLNRAKSTFDPAPTDPVPQSVTRKYEVFENNGMTYTQVTTGADGKSSTGTYSAHFDGKDYPMTGNATSDAIALTRVDPSTFTSELKKDGKVVGTVRNVVSADGKTMTATNTGTNAWGKATKSVVVYDRQ